MSHRAHLRREITETATRAAEIRRKALEMGEREAARRLLVAARLLRATLHCVGTRDCTPTECG